MKLALRGYHQYSGEHNIQTGGGPGFVKSIWYSSLCETAVVVVWWLAWSTVDRKVVGSNLHSHCARLIFPTFINFPFRLIFLSTRMNYIITDIHYIIRPMLKFEDVLICWDPQTFDVLILFPMYIICVLVE